MTVQPSRNLVIVHTQRAQALSDWMTVKEKINARAPDIDVRITDNWTYDPEIAEWQVTRPSLVFSPCNLLAFQPTAGKIYVGRYLDKSDEMRRLVAAGIPTPRSVALIPGLSLDPAVWGEYVVVKPLGEGGSLGQSIRLARAETVGARHAELTLNGRLEMLVQKLVDATDESGRLYAYRVLTVLGAPLYNARISHIPPRPPLAEISDQRTSVIAHNVTGVKRDRRLSADEDVLELARKTGAAMRDFPCLGLDIVRQRTTGELFVLETNPGGNVWHLSSALGMLYAEKYRRKLYNQFGALEIVADRLIERARQEASWLAV
jgi:hypothetical protein